MRLKLNHQMNWNKKGRAVIAVDWHSFSSLETINATIAQGDDSMGVSWLNCMLGYYYE